VIGSRYLCLKNGIGVGLSLPYDPDYEDEYEPIDDRKYYCGDKSPGHSPPEGYDAIGSNAICHRIGVGAGKRLKIRSRSRS